MFRALNNIKMLLLFTSFLAEGLKMNKTKLKNYAKLIVRVGANVQKGQPVLIYASVETRDLVYYVAKECFNAGAKTVDIQWSDDKIDRLKWLKTSLKSLVNVPQWKVEKMRYIASTLPTRIYISSEDPDGMHGVDGEKFAKASSANYALMKPFITQMENKFQWTIVGYPSTAWAKKVFPELTKSQAVKKLEEAILMTSRCDDDPIKSWKEHNANLIKHAEWLNSLDIEYLHYESSNGTDFKVWLNPLAQWLAGGETVPQTGVYYNPNIPTEEVFTTPIKGKAEGIVYSSKPLSYQGQLIEDFSVRFKDGKVVEVKAKRGLDALEKMVKTDEGASMLGEVALVPFDSPINLSGILFYSTLYDENAACHLALGKGFTNTIKNYEKYSDEELHAFGVNESMIHVDFMIGTRDLKITAHTRNNGDLQVFSNGNWVK